jgi:DNA transformation protein
MSDFHAFVEELFAGFGPVRIRRMFGGAGIWAGEVMFGLIDDETIYLRADEPLKAELQALGSVNWVYRGGAKPMEMTSYWRLPESALDDPDEAAAWARKSLVAAEAHAAKKKPKKKR